MFNENKLDWSEWLKNGDQYLKAATPKKEKSRFGPEIRYNLLSLSLEGYVMAMLGYHNNLPFNHTFTDLMQALEKIVPIPEALKDQILKYENIQSICSIEKYSRRPPDESELDDLKDAVIRIGAIAHEICGELKTA